MAIWRILSAVGCAMQINLSSEGGRLKMWYGVAVVVACVVMAGCDRGPKMLVPVPLGERSALERLAKSYTQVSDRKYATSPMSLPGAERKKFVVEVFAGAGYDYSATLDLMANQGLDPANQLHVDLADLVLLPHRRPKYPTDPADVYSSEELMDVAAVERALRMR